MILCINAVTCRDLQHGGLAGAPGGLAELQSPQGALDAALHPRGLLEPHPAHPRGLALIYIYD